jgi:hypothetical protein
VLPPSLRLIRSIYIDRVRVTRPTGWELVSGNWILFYAANRSREQYYIADHHDPIVSREIWDRAQELLDKQSWQKWKRREQQRLMPVRSGLLKGFVSISSEWKAVSITRLVSASNKVLKDEATTDDKQSNAEEYNDEESEENEMAENSVLEGFEVVELEQS